MKRVCSNYLIKTTVITPTVEKVDIVTLKGVSFRKLKIKLPCTELDHHDLIPRFLTFVFFFLVLGNLGLRKSKGYIS